MRNRNDLKSVRFSLLCGVTLDMERVEQDPAWGMAGRHYDLDDPQQFDAAVVEYLKHYLGAESILSEMPSTNGPADVYGTTIEGPHELRRQREAARARALADSD